MGDKDLKFMQEALKLAAQGRGCVSPNPLVGAVVVKGDMILGRGFHLYAHQKHAEIGALDEAETLTEGATLYVNLEPCCHYGRTGPCTEAVIDSGVRRVVAAMTDPNPRVAGKGFEILRAAGIEVEVGLCEAEARKLNEKFIHYIAQERPFVHLKTAMTLDGKIATHTGHSQWITGEEARNASHRLRNEYDAILVGVGTVKADDPQLTSRIKTKRKRHRNLMRVVLDGHLTIPEDAKLFEDAQENPFLIFADEQAALLKHGAEGLDDKIKAFAEAGAQVILLPGENGRINLANMLDELGKRQLCSLIVEGGPDVSGQFLTSGLIDKVTFFIAPKLVGGKNALAAVGGEGFAQLDQALNLTDITITRHGEDIEITGYPIKPTQ